MKLNSVPLTNRSSKRKAIRENLEKQVIIQDAQEGWMNVIPTSTSVVEHVPSEQYKVRLLDSRWSGRSLELYYSNLRTLLVLTPEEGYPLPEI